MRIAFVCCEYPPAVHGGIGTFTQLLARGLVARGHEVRVLGIYPPQRAAPAYEVDGGVRVWRLREPRPPFGWVAARARLFSVVRKWCRAGDVDLVEVPDYEGWSAGWPALPVPVVVRAHGSATYFGAETECQVPWQLRWLEWWGLRRADVWCAVSTYAGTRTSQLFQLEPPAAVLYNPVDPAGAGQSDAPSGTTVVFTGTLTEKKGIVQLIRTWPDVLGRVPAANLHVFGKDTPTTGRPSMRAHLEQLLPEAARPTVHFHGHVTRERLRQALRSARVAVFPSYAEAFAIAPLEAMAQGCPTIVSTRGAGRELAGPERAVLLVDPSRPDQIANAVVRVLADDGLARHLATAGRSAVERRFALHHVVPANEMFYQQCLKAATGDRIAC